MAAGHGPRGHTRHAVHHFQLCMLFQAQHIFALGTGPAGGSQGRVWRRTTLRKCWHCPTHSAPKQLAMSALDLVIPDHEGIVATCCMCIGCSVASTVDQPAQKLTQTCTTEPWHWVVDAQLIRVHSRLCRPQTWSASLRRAGATVMLLAFFVTVPDPNGTEMCFLVTAGGVVQSASKLHHLDGRR